MDFSTSNASSAAIRDALDAPKRAAKKPTSSRIDRRGAAATSRIAPGVNADDMVIRRALGVAM